MEEPLTSSERKSVSSNFQLGWAPSGGCGENSLKWAGQK